MAVETLAAQSAMRQVGKLVELKEEYYPDVDMNDLFVKKSNDTVLKNFVDNIACVACAEINILNPDSIIFGGGVINMKGFPKDYLEERLYVHARKPYPAESLKSSTQKIK